MSHVVYCIYFKINVTVVTDAHVKNLEVGHSGRLRGRLLSCSTLCVLAERSGLKAPSDLGHEHALWVATYSLSSPIVGDNPNNHPLVSSPVLPRTLEHDLSKTHRPTHKRGTQRSPPRTHHRSGFSGNHNRIKDEIRSSNSKPSSDATATDIRTRTTHTRPCHHSPRALLGNRPIMSTLRGRSLGSLRMRCLGPRPLSSSWSIIIRLRSRLPSRGIKGAWGCVIWGGLPPPPLFTFCFASFVCYVGY